ncbi:hypothetical protein CDD83_1464 [Cordyceps sp. RAO-2017]|nr:hypothetical protein CDD83_1464 [Cordyceps sp. RAO-2017]
MAAPPPPTADARFDVGSGAVCFGTLSDIRRGAEASAQAPLDPRPRLAGTVVEHPLAFHVAAANGTWNVFALRHLATSSVAGWFAAHADVDAVPELVRILRVSGSPYEYEHGDAFNSAETRRQRVLVINRYDWGTDPDGAPGADNGLGLVDRALASGYVRDWARRKPGQRGASSHGVWLCVPDAEYMFARFGLDDDHGQARSFLFFTDRTDFFRTGFPGQPGPLRTYETEVQRLRRGLGEGRDYAGVDELRKLYELSPRELQDLGPSWRPEQPPPESERLGPYDAAEHVFREQHLELLRLYRPSPFLGQASAEQQEPEPAIAVFVDALKGATYELLNELAMSFVERFVLPHRMHSAPSTAGPALFPHHDDADHLDSHCIDHFNAPHARPIPGLDLPSVSARIRAFLARRAGDVPVSLDQDSLTGIARVVAFLMTETLELADKLAFGRDDSDGGEACCIVPSHVRMAVYHDADLLAVLRYSAVFWAGRQRQDNAG